MILYHASNFKTNVLRPGYYYKKKIVFWDNTESNAWLYASTEKQVAIDQGFASAIEKKYNIDNYSSHEHDIYITFSIDQKIPRYQELLNSLGEIYLYTIKAEQNDNWIKVNNTHNGLENEYKTMSHISQIKSTELIDLNRWLRDKQVHFNPRPVYFKDW